MASSGVGATADKSGNPWLRWGMADDTADASPTTGPSPFNAVPPAGSPSEDESGAATPVGGAEPRDGAAGADQVHDEGGHLTDDSSTESASPDRWRRLGDRSLALGEHLLKIWTKLVQLWGSMLDALRNEETDPAAFGQSSSPPGRRAERRDAPAPIRVSAQGHVYDFIIHASFTWSSDRLRQETLSGYAHYYMPDVVLRLTHLAAERAGNFAPHQAADLQADLQRKLAKKCPWRYDRGDVVVECQPHVRVELDERVKQLVMPYSKQRIKLDCELNVALRRADHFERLSLRWLTILEKPVDGSVAGGAGQTANKDLAQAVQRMVAEHKAALRRLKDLLDETLRDSDIFTRATPFDTPTKPRQRQAQEASERPGSPTASAPGGSAPSSGRPDEGSSPSG